MSRSGVLTLCLISTYMKIGIILLTMLSRVSPRRMDMVCYGGLQSADFRYREAYRLDRVELPYLGHVRMTFVLPREWNLAYCCHRLQVHFNVTDLRAHATVHPEAEVSRPTGSLTFSPFVRWTICSPDLSHWQCVIKWNAAQHDLVSSGQELNGIPTGTVIKQGSWSLALEQCLNPVTYLSRYELAIEYDPMVHSKDIVYRSPRDKGNITVESYNAIANKYGNTVFERFFEESRPRRDKFCVMDVKSHLVNDHWTLLHQNVSLSRDASLYYKFVFSLEVPTNSEIIRIYFLRENADVSSMSLGVPSGRQRPDNTTADLLTWCEPRGNDFPIMSINTTKRQFRRDSPIQEDKSIVPDGVRNLQLSIGNAWAGCSIENRNGKPTYLCEGGRTFQYPATITIALLLCGPIACRTDPCEL